MKAAAPPRERLRFLFLRAYEQLQGGGPVPPLGILYLAATLRERYGERIDIQFVDLGLTTFAEAMAIVGGFRPRYVGISAMSCEDALLHRLAGSVKQLRPEAAVIVGGPHASILRERMLEDEHIDVVVVGEAERTLIELIDTLEANGDPARVRGIAYRHDARPTFTGEAEPIADLDALPFPAWDLIDFDRYARRPNWNGPLKEERFAELFTSRGCPYGCVFCHNLFGKKIRLRSPESVLAEIRHVHDRFGIREFHVLDDIFNADDARARRICESIVAAGLHLSLAFPNGLRADLLTAELLDLLERAGAYKIHFGFETASPRLQRAIGKNLDLPLAMRMIDATARSGIVTGAYFMFGFPGQTKEEMLATVDYAVHSRLDSAYFFKATPFPGSSFFRVVQEGENRPENFADCHFYSRNRSYGEMDANELNALILSAQRRFYFRFDRLWQGLRKAPNKRRFLKNLVTAAALVLQSFLLRQLSPAAGKEKP
ncbi:MAG TPA: radical SAM protein [bacterium]|nr:radical SAM protein [bacterium]